MSLQENGPNQQNEMSAEEKDLQRALAESMASHEAHQNPKKRSLERPERPPQLANPPKVDEDVPAGMRNVGSSCWFNCVLQVNPIYTLDPGEALLTFLFFEFHFQIYYRIPLNFTEISIVIKFFNSSSKFRILNFMRILFF